MDEYHCNAYPKITATNFVTKNNISPCPNDKYFNVEFEYTNMYVLNARKFHTYCDTTCHNFRNISKDKMMRETTIVSWLSKMCVPDDAFMLVLAKILKCACDMVNRTHKKERVMSMRVDVVVTRASEDGNGEDEDEDEESDDFEEEEEEVEDEEDHGLVPAAMSSIEGLEMVRVEEEGKCAICFEDFHVGVCMPCFHMFHPNCIGDWLRIGNSCPLCRFQMPTNKSE